MKPLKNLVQILIVESEDIKEGIIIPDSVKNKGLVRKGEVIAIGPSLRDRPEGVRLGYTIGSHVFFHYHRPEPSQGEPVLVPDSDILAVDEEFEETDQSKALFPLPPWSDFIAEYDDSFDEFSSIKSFAFFVNFLRHDIPKEKLQRVIYEEIVKVFRNRNDLELHQINLGSIDERTAPAVEIQDDLYASSFQLLANELRFQTQTTTIENLFLALPVLSEAIRNILKSPLFREVIGVDCERICFANTIISQHIRLMGKGKNARVRVLNWEVMRRLLAIEREKRDAEVNLFSLLGSKQKSLRRTDVTIGFDRDIEEREYIIYIQAQAPANEERTLLTIEWQIQDHNPMLIFERDYSPVIKNFFIGTVLGRFFREWFKDVHCVAMGSK